VAEEQARLDHEELIWEKKQEKKRLLEEKKWRKRERREVREGRRWERENERREAKEGKEEGEKRLRDSLREGKERDLRFRRELIDRTRKLLEGKLAALGNGKVSSGNSPPRSVGDDAVDANTNPHGSNQLPLQSSPSRILQKNTSKNIPKLSPARGVEDAIAEGNHNAASASASSSRQTKTTSLVISEGSHQAAAVPEGSHQGAVTPVSDSPKSSLVMETSDSRSSPSMEGRHNEADDIIDRTLDSSGILEVPSPTQTLNSNTNGTFDGLNDLDEGNFGSNSHQTVQTHSRTQSRATVATTHGSTVSSTSLRITLSTEEDILSRQNSSSSNARNTLNIREGRHRGMMVGNDSVSLAKNVPVGRASTEKAARQRDPESASTRRSSSLQVGGGAGAGTGAGAFPGVFSETMKREPGKESGKESKNNAKTQRKTTKFSEITENNILPPRAVTNIPSSSSLVFPKQHVISPLCFVHQHLPSVTKIACGENHFVLLTQSGVAALYGFGNEFCSGSWRDLLVLQIPNERRVETVMEKKWDVCGGGKSGKKLGRQNSGGGGGSFNWGENRDSNGGENRDSNLGSNSSSSSPVLLSSRVVSRHIISRRRRVTDVACGSHHTMLSCDDGSLWAHGDPLMFGVPLTEVAYYANRYSKCGYRGMEEEGVLARSNNSGNSADNEDYVGSGNAVNSSDHDGTDANISSGVFDILDTADRTGRQCCRVNENGVAEWADAGEWEVKEMSEKEERRKQRIQYLEAKLNASKGPSSRTRRRVRSRSKDY